MEIEHQSFFGNSIYLIVFYLLTKLSNNVTVFGNYNTDLINRAILLKKCKKIIVGMTCPVQNVDSEIGRLCI